MCLKNDSKDCSFESNRQGINLHLPSDVCRLYTKETKDWLILLMLVVLMGDYYKALIISRVHQAIMFYLMILKELLEISSRLINVKRGLTYRFITRRKSNIIHRTLMPGQFV